LISSSTLPSRPGEWTMESLEYDLRWAANLSK
jgi:hypothetical protein